MIKLKIDKNDVKPYYLQIQEKLTKMIESGELHSDTRLLPSDKWAPMIGVNKNTLDSVLVNLMHQGLIYRRRNIGTFVKGKSVDSINKKLDLAKILVLLPDNERLNYPYTQEIIKGINSQASSYNLETKVEVFTTYKEKYSEWWKKIPNSNGVKGLIIDKEGFNNIETMKLIDNYKGKVVFFSSWIFCYNHIPSVRMNNAAGGFLATEYLIKLGHKKIAIILRSNIVSIPRESYGTDSEKLDGYNIAFEKHNIEIKKEYLKEGVYSNPEKIKVAVEELLKSKQLPTAILTADDIIALEVVNVLNQKGIKVPDDISIIGFNNLIHSQICYPKLTTVETPMKEMGKKSVDLLFESSNNVNNKHFVLDAKLIERDSVKKI